MAYDEEDNYLMLSGIQHFIFCKRQWAMIHIEQQWAENVRTVEGQQLHEKADQPFIREKRGDKLIVRGMPIKSKELKVTGVCDVVEFIEDDYGVNISGVEGKYTPFPIEYKRGKPKMDDSDVLQLTAQSMCLEEMLICEVNTGYMYYDEIKHRVEVPITQENREKTRLIVSEMYGYYNRKYTPKVKTGSFCKSCSLHHICLPKLMNKQSVKSYIEGKIRE